MRETSFSRKTKETDIEIRLNLDTGRPSIVFNVELPRKGREI